MGSYTKGDWMISQSEIDRIVRLIDLPLDDLRSLAFDGGEIAPSKREAKDRFRGLSKGKLIGLILSQELVEE